VQTPNAKHQIVDETTTTTASRRTSSIEHRRRWFVLRCPLSVSMSVSVSMLVVSLRCRATASSLDSRAGWLMHEAWMTVRRRKGETEPPALSEEQHRSIHGVAVNKRVPPTSTRNIQAHVVATSLDTHTVPTKRIESQPRPVSMERHSRTARMPGMPGAMRPRHLQILPS